MTRALAQHAHDVGFLHDQEFLPVALGLFLGVDTLDHDAVMQRTKFGFSHDSSFWRLQFSGLVQVWFAIESGLRIRGHLTPSTARKVRILSNHALGVLIVRPGIWLGADPVKQTRVKTG